MDESPEPVTVGVTGHRFLAEPDRLCAAVEQALDRVRGMFPGHELRVLSPLAEGADQMVARAVLARGGELAAPLPLPQAEYLQDFATEASRAEFAWLLSRAAEAQVLPPTATRDEAYEQVGRFVVDHCDVLIALWDGQDAQGSGGTGEMVRRALERGVPVLHIKAGNRRPGTHEATSLGEEQGALAVYPGRRSGPAR